MRASAHRPASGLSLVVGARFGEDAALDFFGGMVGQSLGEGFVGTLSGIQQRDARAAEAASQARYGFSLGRSPEAALTAGLAGALPEADALFGEWAGERAERAAAAADVFAHGRLRDPHDGAPIDFASKLADPALYYRGATTLSEAAVAPRLKEAFGTYGSLEPIGDWEAFFIFDRPGQFLAGAARLPGNMLEAGREFGRMGNDAIGKLVYTIGNAVTGSEVDYPYTSQLGQLIAQEGLGTAALKTIGGTVHGLVSPLKAAYQGDFEALGEGVAELAAGLGAGKVLTTMGKGTGLVDDVGRLVPDNTSYVTRASETQSLTYDISRWGEYGLPSDGYFARTLRESDVRALMAGEKIEFGGRTISPYVDLKTRTLVEYPEGAGFVSAAEDLRKR